MRTAALAVACLLTCAAAAAPAAPPTWNVDKAHSSIAISGTQLEVPFTGSFGQWEAVIRFDPADLPHSSARVTIATASARTGDKTQGATLAQSEWLDPGRFPSATFATTGFKARGADRYVASGTLTIKGKALPVTLPFTLSIKGDLATMRGRIEVDRVAYGIGTQTDATGSLVSRMIGVEIAVTARRAK